MKIPTIKSPDVKASIRNPKEIYEDTKAWNKNRKLKNELKSKKAILPLVYFENEEIFLYFDAFIRLCSAFVAANKALAYQPNSGGVKKAIQDKNQQLLYCFQNYVCAYPINFKCHIYIFEKENTPNKQVNSNVNESKEILRLKDIESLAKDYDDLPYFRQSLANYFESNFMKYAQSNNYYDKFRYYRIFTNKEIFDTFIVTFVDLALIGISVAFPGATPATLTGKIIFTSLIGGKRVASPLLKRAYFTFRSEKYDGLIFEIPSEFIGIYDAPINQIMSQLKSRYDKKREVLIEENRLISQNRVNTENKIHLKNSKFKEINYRNINDYYDKIKHKNYLNNYISDLNDLNKISVSLEKMTRQASRNGLVNYNLSNLFHYYKELIEKSDKFVSKTGFNYNSILKDAKSKILYKNDLEELKHLYFKTLNFSRYMKALKTPLNLQIGSARLGLLKSMDCLFKSDSALYYFVKENIKKDDDSILHYIDVIKKTLNNKYKKNLTPDQINSYTNLIYKSLILSDSSRNDTETYNQDLEAKLSTESNLQKFGKEASDWMKSLTSTSFLTGRVYGYTKNLFTAFKLDDSWTKAAGTGQSAYVTLGGTLLYDLVLGICYFGNDRVPSEKFKNFNDWVGILFSFPYIAHNAVGLANGISVWSTGAALDQLSSHAQGISTSLSNSLLNNLVPDPISFLVQDIGYFAASNAIGNAEKKMWQSIIKNYYEYREYDKSLRNREQNFNRDSAKEKKLYENHHRISKTAFVSSFLMNFSSPGAGFLHPELVQYAKYKIAPDVRMDNQIHKPDRKIWRPAYDYAKKQDKGASEYMRNISKSYSDSLTATMKAVISVNSDIIKLFDLISRVEDKSKKMTRDDIDSFKTFRKYVRDHDKIANIDDIISSYTKLVMKILGVASQIESYNRYLDDFVEALLTEVDDTLQIYLGYTIEDLNDDSNFDVLKNLKDFGEMEEISKSVLKQDFPFDLYEKF